MSDITFIKLHRVYILGIFPKLLCLLQEISDGVITEHRIDYKIRRFGNYSEYSGSLDVVINNMPQSYIIDKESYSRINFRDKDVMYCVGNYEPFLQGCV
jgi:hypothetical protein